MKRIVRNLLASAGLLTLLAFVSQDQKPVGEMNMFKKINEFTDSLINQGDVAGTITLVSHRGKVAHFESKGMMNIEKSQPMQKDTLFRIYSMTKPVTTVAAMILYERGKFDLDAPVSKFIPEFKNVEVFVSGSAVEPKTEKPNREITMGDLLTHTSGLTYGFFYTTVVDEMYRNEKIPAFSIQEPLADFVKKVARMPLLFSPGEKWNYGHSTDILGRVIEVISGQSLDVFLKKEIFEPLGMGDTDFYVPQEKQDRFAANYLHSTDSTNPTLVVADDPKTGEFSKPPIACMGGAGLVSTAGDFLKFSTMLLNKGRVGDKQILRAETVDMITKSYLPGDIHSFASHPSEDFIPKGRGMGLGVGVTLDPTLENTPGNPGTYGWTGAAHTLFFIDPKEELIAIFLTQVFPADYKLEMMREFRTAVYESIGY